MDSWRTANSSSFQKLRVVLPHILSELFLHGFANPGAPPWITWRVSSFMISVAVQECSQRGQFSGLASSTCRPSFSR